MLVSWRMWAVNLGANRPSTTFTDFKTFTFRLLGVLHPRSPLLDADSLCRLSAYSNQRTHGFRGRFPPHSGLRLFEIRAKFLVKGSVESLLLDGHCLNCRPRLYGRCLPHVCRLHCTMERSILLSMGHWLCQDPYSHHCVRL